MLEIVLLIITSVSVMSTFVVFCSYLTFPSLRTSIYRVITYLALADFIWELLVIVCQFDNDSFRCTMYAYLITSFQMSSVLWTIYIAFIVKDSILKQREYAPKHSCWVYPVVCYIVPLAFSALPFSTNLYDSTDMTWCLLTKSSSLINTLWFFLTFYIPLLVGLCYCAFSYHFSSKIMRENLSVIQLDVSELRKRLQYIRKLKSFPLILVVCWLPQGIAGIVILSTNSSIDFHYLSRACALLSCLQGVLNAFAYSYSSTLGYYLRSRLCPKRQLEEEDQRDELIDDLMSF